MNRLTQMDAYKGLNYSNHSVTPVKLMDYQERPAYDPNGNITNYVRHGYGANIPMDSLTYNYYANTNQLQRINDGAGGSYTTDLKDQGTGSNYTYDLIGNLKQDVTNGVSYIGWTVYGKIDTVTNGSGTITYTYDAAGNRITKTAGTTTTVYVRDAQGNILSIYTQTGSANPVQTEVDLYGSSRLGSVRALTVAPTTFALTTGYGNATVSTFTRAEKSYELTNHLGNVLTTVTDKKIAVVSGSNSSLIDHFTADIATAQDYYPFGMLMPGRTYTASTATNYRFGFNGKENDNEVKGTGNEIDYGMRYYDPRAGRFMSVDPLQKKYPWFTPYQYAGNSPIANIDIDGLENYNYNLVSSKNADGKPILAIQYGGKEDFSIAEVFIYANKYNTSEIYNLSYNGQVIAQFTSFQDLKTVAHGRTVQEISQVGLENEAGAFDRIMAIHQFAESLREPHNPVNNGRNPVQTQQLHEEAANEGPTASSASKSSTPRGAIYKQSAAATQGVQKFGGRAIIVDENLSPKIASELQQKGYNVKMFSKGTLDPDIIAFAKQNDAIILTNNIKDFKNRGITTIKVTENMKKASEVNNVVNYIENVNKGSATDATLLKRGNNINLSQHQQ